MEIKKIFFRKEYLYFLVILLCSSCAMSGQKKSGSRFSQHGEYKVTVETEGRKLNNLEQNLIHRIRISSSDIISVFGTKDAPRIPQLSVKKGFDGKGELIGLEIVNETPVSSALGLKFGDIITAVGFKLVREKTDLMNFGRLFSGSSELSFTFERNGAARKTILYRKGI
jgi:hypothetical protein